jgi:hypothetical protein
VRAAVQWQRSVGGTGLRADPRTVGPSPAYGRLLEGTLKRLAAERGPASAQLGAASTPRAQAAASRRLQSAYAQAASALSGARPGTAEQANGEIVRAMSAAATGYGAMAGAADRGDRGAFDSAASGVRSATATLARDVAGLAALGYAIA